MFIPKSNMYFDKISSVLLYCLLVYPVKSQNFVNTFSRLPYGVEKTCVNNVSGCQLRVSIECQYKSPIDGSIQSCIDTERNLQRPFLNLLESECKRFSPVWFTITYTICNDNDLVFTPIKNKHAIRFREDNVVEPDDWNNAMAPNTCRRFVLDSQDADAVNKVDLCQTRRVIDNEMDGDLSKEFPKYCRCYLYKESNTVIRSDPIPVPPPTEPPTANPTVYPTKDPTANPTQYPTANPTKDPTANPTQYPTANPTKFPTANPTQYPTAYVTKGDPTAHPTDYPTKYPTGSPVEERCYFIFTEFADPEDYAEAGYIEIKSNCPGRPIDENLFVQTRKYPSQQFRVKDFISFVPHDGFIIVCKNRSEFSLFYGVSCDIEIREIQPEGIFPVFLKMGSKVIDAYGSLDGIPPGSFFPNGRIVRDINYPVPSKIFVPEMYCVFKKAGVDDNDPREWASCTGLVLFFTEFCDDPTSQFIELYSPNKKNYKITEKLVIIRYDEHFNLYGVLSLTGMTLNENGFLVLCVSYLEGGKCTSVLGSGSFVDAPGTDKYALSACVTCPRIDSYGFGCSTELHDYTDGRAVRKIDAEPTPSADFVLDHWIITPGSGVCDPGEWKESPTPTPTSGFPSKGSPSKGKGYGSPSKGYPSGGPSKGYGSPSKGYPSGGPSKGYSSPSKGYPSGGPSKGTRRIRRN